MGFFNLRSKKLTDDELRDALFNAVAGSNASALKNLLTSHFERVIAIFPTWTTLPPSARSDPSRTKWWAEGMIGVASAAAELGEGALVARLQGPPEQNILILWQEAFLAAEADAAGGDYSSGIKKLEEVLEKAKGLTGPGVDHLLPKTYGLLGTLSYRAGNREQAHEFTLEAKTYCERIGDHEGAEIYARNLDIIARGGKFSPQVGARVVFRDAAGRQLTTDDLQGISGKVRWEVIGTGAIPAAASRLHTEARAAAGRGDYAHALNLLEEAHRLAPDWPYPVYDTAFTYLLQGNSAKAEEHYAEVDRMAPRGFYTAKTSLDCLRRERAGVLFPGFCNAFASLEWMNDKAKKKALLERIVEKYPAFPPAWEELSRLLGDDDARLQAITRGLEHDPDPETKGMLLINRALVLHRRGDRDGAIKILGELSLDPESTLATEMLAKATMVQILR